MGNPPPAGYAQTLMPSTPERFAALRSSAHPVTTNGPDRMAPDVGASIAMSGPATVTSAVRTSTKLPVTVLWAYAAIRYVPGDRLAIVRKKPEFVNCAPNVAPTSLRVLP